MLPKNTLARFEYALKIVDVTSILAQLDNPVYRDELIEMFKNKTGIKLNSVYKHQIDAVYKWAESHKNWNKSIGRLGN